MSRTRTIGAAAGLAAVGLLASTSALWALLGQGGPLMWTAVAGFAESHDKRAFRLIEQSKAPASLDAAQREADRALTLSPYSNPARLRLAYIDTVRHGGLGPAGVDELARSYDLVAFDYAIAAWRVRFGLEHWQSLSPELRSRVHAEAIAFGTLGIHDVNMLAVLQTIHDPAGRLAAELWLLELAMQAQLLDSEPHRAGNRP